MSENEHILGGLLRKRSELAGRIEHAQTEMRQMMIDLDHLDSTIKMFAPDIDLMEVKPKPFPPRWSAYQGEIGRIVLNTLREATKPISTHDLTMLVMTDRKLNTTDLRLVRMMNRRVSSCLRHHRGRGLLRSLDGPKRSQSWEIADL